VDRLLFSGLVRFDERGWPHADLADSWGVSQDGTIYNFTIRPNAVWHDGTPVTSDDVIFTIEMMKSAGSLYPQDIKDLWSRVEVTRLNEKNLKFTLPEPYVPFIDYLTFGVVPKHLLESIPPDQLAKRRIQHRPCRHRSVPVRPVDRGERSDPGSGPDAFHKLLRDARFHRTGRVPLLSHFAAEAFEAYRQGDVFAVGQITSDVLNAALEEPNLSFYTSRMPQMGFVFSI
jgi:peptide/nickel transport system substrate-binding protein